MKLLERYREAARPLAVVDVELALNPNASWRSAIDATHRHALMLAIAPSLAEFVVRGLTLMPFAGAAMFAVVYLHIAWLLGPQRAQIRRMLASLLIVNLVGPGPHQLSGAQGIDLMVKASRIQRRIVWIEMALAPALAVGSLLVLLFLHSSGADPDLASYPVTLLLLVTIGMALLNLRFSAELKKAAGSR